MPETKMRALKFNVSIDSNHRIKLQLPLDTPEGEVEVIVLIPDSLSPTKEGLRSFFDELDGQPRQGRTKENIDAQIAKERASWD